jgi:type II secretory pathway component GspD/PulD (secretin)
MIKKISPLTKSGFSSIHVRGKRWLGIASTVALFLSACPAQSLEPKWPAGPYRYLVIDQDVRDILSEFGRNLNITVKMSDQVGARRLRGRLPISNAKEFLNRLCESYGLVWYYDGAVLHISAQNEVRTEAVDLGTVNPNGMHEKLTALGIFDPRYQLLSAPDSRVLSVSGPPPYLARIREVVAMMQKSNRPRNVREVQDGDEYRVRVFRGKSQGGS